MKARKGQYVTSRNLDPTQAWKVIGVWADTISVTNGRKGKEKLKLGVPHGSYTITGVAA